MWIIADVSFDTDEQAAEAERLVREKKLAGISADLGTVTERLEVLAIGEDGMPSDWLETIESGEITGGSLVPMPAFGDARIVVNPDGTLTAWLLPEGETTSDRRFIQDGGLTWRDPAPLMFTDVITEGHLGAVFVGNLTNFRRAELSMVAAFTLDPSHFVDPQLPAVTKPHVEDSRYLGHGAQWGTCHLAFPGCVTPPETKTQYEIARWKEYDGAEGVPIYLHPKGDIHAPLHLTLEETKTWYEENCTLEGLALVGDDTFGIWVTGDVSPEVADKYLSGDWRLTETVEGPNLELMAFLACDRPAFPLALVASDVQTALVAAGIVTETAPPEPTLEALRLLSNEVISLRQDIEPVLIEREAKQLLASVCAPYGPSKFDEFLGIKTPA